MPPVLREKGVDEQSYHRWVLEIVGWLYGERGAPKAWRSTLLAFLLGLKQWSFQQSTFDADILFHVSEACCIFIILFVDDIWVFSQTPEDAAEIISLLRQRFKCTESFVPFHATIRNRFKDKI